MKDNRKKRKRFLPIWFLLIALLIGGCGSETESRQTDAITQQTLTETADTLEETQEQRASKKKYPFKAKKEWNG